MAKLTDAADFGKLESSSGDIASHLHIPLFIHPQTPPRAVREAYYSGFDLQRDCREVQPLREG
jgi:hypothetical protein